MGNLEMTSDVELCSFRFNYFRTDSLTEKDVAYNLAITNLTEKF